MVNGMEGVRINATANDDDSRTLDAKSASYLISKCTAQRDYEISTPVDNSLDRCFDALRKVACALDCALCCPRAVEVHHTQGSSPSSKYWQQSVEGEVNIKNWSSSLGESLSPNEGQTAKQRSIEAGCAFAANRQDANLNPGSFERHGVSVHITIEATWTSF
jgi:hypothetical protein